MNPLGGMAETMARLSAVLRTPKPPPAPAQLSRAARRAAGQRSSSAANGQQLTAARRTGELAGRRGADHLVPGTCPYADHRLVDAWARGYVIGRRKREAKL